MRNSFMKVDLALAVVCSLALAAPPVRAAASAPAVTPATAGDEAPAWLRQAAERRAPVYDKDVEAVVLHDEEQVQVEQGGRTTSSKFYAVRVISRGGRAEAVAREFYNSQAGKVREMRAWLIRPDGTIKRYGDKQAMDVSGAGGDLYDEYRLRVISAADEAEANSVFGFESVTEFRDVSTQSAWHFQGQLPALVSRYSVTLPAGWRAASLTFNHAPIAPAVSGTTYTWELRDLPPIKEEPNAPSVSNIVPRLAVSYLPAGAGDAKLAAGGSSFADWTDVSRWLTTLTDAQATVNDALAAKARALTANSKTELERIAAIGRYVQNIQYVSIQFDLARGGGYRPRPAIDVFARAYGDCKDKANLMRAMLKVVGIESFLLPIYSGDPNYVREEWASPHQFNHCIIAIRISPESRAATAIEHPTLGKLMIFDPTDDDTPAGDLPHHEQGSLALLVAGDQGRLLRMPVTPADANRQERTIEASLDPTGALAASVTETSVGQAAVGERRYFRRLARPEYTQVIESWISRSARGAILSRLDPKDDPEANRFRLDVKFDAPSYAQVMNKQLLIFKPAIVSRRHDVPVAEATRRHPVVLESEAYQDIVRVKLPAGFAVDEIPDGQKLDSSFGSFESRYEVADGQLTFTRRLTVRAAVIPVAQYADLRDFFGRVIAAEQAPVVLTRQ